MPPKAAKMSKTFDEAIYDEAAVDLYSSRNVRYDDLVSLIESINRFGNKTSYTRSAPNKFSKLNTRSEEVICKVREENEAFRTALFKINPKIQEDSKYKEDQTEVRKWIEDLENAILDLRVKLEDENVIPTPLIMETPAAASDVATILLQKSKQQERQDKVWVDT